MWKKPSMQKPDFKMVNLDELSDKESIETNGGIMSIPTRLSGMISIPIPIIPIPPKLSGVIAKPFDIIEQK